MKPERIINVKEKFEDLDIDLNYLSLGDFDFIGEVTAKKLRESQSDLWKKCGAFFKPNLERGLLIYSLIVKYKLTSYLEIGFGRGYSALCAAKAFAELNNDGQVMVLEPNVDEDHMRKISEIFPQQWTSRIKLAKTESSVILPKMKDRYDLVFVDGDHTKEAVKSDWRGVENLFSYFCMFDDYHLDTGKDAGIQVAEALEECELPSGVRCELLKTDRRIFVDDRRWPDEQVRYGELLLTRVSEADKKLTMLDPPRVSETFDW